MIPNEDEQDKEVGLENKFLHGRSHKRCLELRPCTHTQTQGEEQVQSCRRCFTMEANMLLDMEWPSRKNYKTKTDTNTSDRQPWQNRTQTRLSNPSVWRQETRNKLRYPSKKHGRPWPPAVLHLSWCWGSCCWCPVSPTGTPHRARSLLGCGGATSCPRHSLSSKHGQHKLRQF